MSSYSRGYIQSIFIYLTTFNLSLKKILCLQSIISRFHARINKNIPRDLYMIKFKLYISKIPFILKWRAREDHLIRNLIKV
jgi:hypothetical protein